MKHQKLTISSISLLLAGLTGQSALAASLSLYEAPLFLTNSSKANVLVILDNSNSMDEAANGSAVGSADPNSKSEIARQAVRDLIATYTGKINMGLMAYQQSNVELRQLHNSPYDASYDPANYDPTFTGPRNSLTKRFRTPNPTDPGSFVYYNIALPFYASANYDSAFCYSSTAVFDNGSENPNTGPWDTYRCFQSKTGTSDALPIWNNSASEAAAGYSSYWFTSTFYPTDSDLAQGILDFGRFMTWNWVSPTWFSNSSPGRGYLHIPVDDLVGTQVTNLLTKLDISQFTNNGPTNPALPLQNAGLTPLKGSLLTANDYFTGQTLPADEGGPAPAIPESCGNDFIALLTDGLPSTDENGNSVSDPATALSEVASTASLLNSNGVETYVIGFALPTGTDPTSLDSIAAAAGTGTAFMANDPTTLKTAFDTIFNDILAKSGSSSSAATNSTSLSSNSVIYQARFSSADWSGQLLAKPISLSGSISSSINWDAAVQLDTKDPDDRVIITYGRDSQDGIPFRWSDIASQTDTVAKDALDTDFLGTVDGLGADRVDFLRGGTGGASASIFRTDRNGKLGDIVHSTPNYVGKPAAGYSDLEMAGYSSFQSSYDSRQEVIYAGANDGMLHGFSAVDGEELLAYVPRAVYSRLSRLTAQGYGTSVEHKYTVDGSPAVADAYASGWKTVLVGGLNAGGQGVYALDVTDPSDFEESKADEIVLWEFTDEDDPDLGYTFFEPSRNFQTNQSAQIVKMNNDKWAVILGNGYNNTEADGNTSSDGHAYLFILFIEEGMDGSWTPGTDYIKIDTGKGSVTSPNGLATPIPNDIDGDGKIDTIYAGDLYGNLWKFDVSDSSASNWDLALTAGKPLFTAEDSSGNRQPITSTPLVTPHPKGGYIVSFGTGKYMELSDNSDSSQQSIYGIWDLDAQVTSRSQLLQQQVITTTSVSGIDYRLMTANQPVWSTHRGWLVDLPEAGERVDVNPVIRDGRFVYVTRTPSTQVCTAGGESWLMELDYLTGGRLQSSPFDVNDDGVIDSDDYITDRDINGDGAIDDQDKAPVSGRRDPAGGMVASPAVITDDAKKEYKILSSSTGTLKTVMESKATEYLGRISWEEIR